MLKVCRFGPQHTMITCTFQVHDLKKKPVSLGPLKSLKIMLSQSFLIVLFVVKKYRAIRETELLQQGQERQLSACAFIGWLAAAQEIRGGSGSYEWDRSQQVNVVLRCHCSYAPVSNTTGHHHQKSNSWAPMVMLFCLAGQSSANGGNQFSHRSEQTFFLACWLACSLHIASYLLHQI